MTPPLDMLTDEVGTSEEQAAAEEVTFGGKRLGLVEEFVEQLIARGASGGQPVDWSIIRQAVSGTDSVEQQIGRAILVADQLARGVFPGVAVQPAPPTFDSTPSAPVVAAQAPPVEMESTPLSPEVPQVIGLLGRLGLRSLKNRYPKLEVIMRRPPYAVALTLSIGFFLLVTTVAVVSNLGGSTAAAYRAPLHSAVTGNAAIAKAAQSGQLTSHAALAPPPAATVPPAPAPPSLSGAAPLRSHEVFGFAPYWTLGQSAQFNVAGLSTIDYFSIGVNPDGSLAESGPGWAGYESQDLANLITRAHGAGDRVVLTVNDFGQSSLDQLTSSATAPATLSTALISAIEAKNLDGVNLDFEGTGSADQAGLTNLVAAVSSAIHGVNSHYQVTMDTYASAAGDTGSFYNIRALAPSVNAFFIMEYQLNLQSGPSSTSPLTSSMFSDKTTIDQYLSAVPASKVILGLPFFGIDWPTNNGTLTAQATGPATDVSYSQVRASGHPMYWDATTDTAWTSYQVGTQWHETFFEDPTSLYDAAQLAGASNLAGVGIWALGMEGNDPSMAAAVGGLAPPTKDQLSGPSNTSQSPATSTTSTTVGAPLSALPALFPTTTPTSGSTSSTATPSTLPPDSDASSTTTVPVDTNPADYNFWGTWQGHRIDLAPMPNAAAAALVTGTSAGALTLFTTSDPADTCLSGDNSLQVLPVVGNDGEYVVLANQPGNCVTASFTFTWS